MPESIKKFIRDCTTSYGKVKLVLQKNKYFVESPYADILERLLKDEAISKSRVKLHVGAFIVVSRWVDTNG